LSCDTGAVFVVLAKRINNKKGKRGERRGEREEGSLAGHAMQVAIVAQKA